MERPTVDIIQLQQRNPLAWTTLLQKHPELDNLFVTAVTAQPLTRRLASHKRPSSLTRYHLALDRHSDPITFIGKQTDAAEVLFYKTAARELATVVPRPWFWHEEGEQGWLLLEEIPNHFPPERWQTEHVEKAVRTLASIHAQFWNHQAYFESLAWLPKPFHGADNQALLNQLRQDYAIYFEEGPNTILSEHGLHSAGSFAPQLLEAANGYVALRSLGGWPGVLGEPHLTVIADLLDDPLPLLEPLRQLPPTLLHGDPYGEHWQLTLFEQHALLDWRRVQAGPCLWDLIAFVEQFDLLYPDQGDLPLVVRQQRPFSDEAIIDTYLLAMSKKLGQQFPARAVRQAIPAARCLYTMLTWLPLFATWFDQLPNPNTWRKLNNATDEQLIGTIFEPFISYRPYFTAVFRRFLRAYRML